MNDLLAHEPFLKAWKNLPNSGKRMLKEFAKYPTLNNQSYAIGYLAALFDNSVISQDSYTYLLSLCGQLPTFTYIINAVREIDS